MAGSAENKALVRRFLDHCFRLEIDPALALATPDFTWWVLGEPGVLRVSGLKDRERAARMLHNMVKNLPDGMAHRILGITAEGDRVAVEVEAEGTWATGEAYRNTYHFLIRIEDGRIVGVREYMDTLAVARLTGVGDACAPARKDLPAK